jgi:hypothetical protein
VAAVPSGLSLTTIIKYSSTRIVKKFGGTEVTTKSPCQGKRPLFRESNSGLAEYKRALTTAPDDRFNVFGSVMFVLFAGSYNSEVYGYALRIGPWLRGRGDADPSESFSSSDFLVSEE